MRSNKKVLEAIPERHRPIFIVMMEYGLRPQEATALKWDCVDFEKNTITFKRSHSEYVLRESTKTGVIRSERITQATQDAIELARKFSMFRGYVFVHNDRGSHYDNKTLNRIWKMACQEVHIQIPLYEAVRHSLGCQLLDMGYTKDFVKDVYRHTSIKTTERYAQRRRSMIADALENRGKVVEFRKQEAK